LPRGSLPSP